MRHLKIAAALRKSEDSEYTRYQLSHGELESMPHLIKSQVYAEIASILENLDIKKED